jgi:hypothetical protein
VTADGEVSAIYDKSINIFKRSKKDFDKRKTMTLSERGRMNVNEKQFLFDHKLSCLIKALLSTLQAL